MLNIYYKHNNRIDNINNRNRFDNIENYTINIYK